MPKQQEINIAYGRIGILEFSFKELPKKIIDSWNEDFLNVELKIAFSYDVANNLFVVIPDIKYTIIFEDEAIEAMSLSLLNEFYIDNLKDIINIDNEVFKMPDEILLTLLGLSFSTARGVIAAKTNGSFISTKILPIVDPKTILNSIKNQMNENITKS